MADIRNLSIFVIKFRSTFFLDFEDKEAKCIVDNFYGVLQFSRTLKNQFYKRPNNSQ